MVLSCCLSLYISLYLPISLAISLSFLVNIYLFLLCVSLSISLSLSLSLSLSRARRKQTHKTDISVLSGEDSCVGDVVEDQGDKLPLQIQDLNQKIVKLSTLLTSKHAGFNSTCPLRTPVLQDKDF